MASTPPTASPTLHSRRSSGRSSPRTPLSLDLSSLPPLSSPAPPSNTLLITKLDSLDIFHPASLATIRQYISTLVPNELHSFSPLRSLRRIVCSFYSIDAAIKVRQELDGAAILGVNSPVSASGEDTDNPDQSPVTARTHEIRARIYFGEPTPVDNAKQYLNKPDAGKLFFISPPPSPPVGWESTREGAPNTEAHADDLKSALEQLGSKIRDGGMPAGPSSEGVSELEVQVNNAATSGDAKAPTPAKSPASASGTRTRSGSTTMIYDPKAHATKQSKHLPSVMVEDTTYVEEEEDVDGPRLDGGTRIIAHTSRPPVELMHDA